MNKKATNIQLICSVVLILTAVVFGMMLFNVGNRFINQGGIYAQYHLMESAYTLETMLAAPSFVEIGYHFDLRQFDFNFHDDHYQVLFGGFESGKYDFSFDRNNRIKIGPFYTLNFFTAHSNVEFSSNQYHWKKQLCPIKETSLDNPRILLAILNKNDNYQDLFSLYQYINEVLSHNVYFEEIKNNKVSVENNLSIIFSDDNYYTDIIIYYKNDIKSSKLACLIYNNFISRDYHLNIVLVPSNEINSNVKISFNFESLLFQSIQPRIPMIISESLEVYFN